MKNRRILWKVFVIAALLVIYTVSAFLVFRPWYTRTANRSEAEAEAERFLQSSFAASAPAQVIEANGTTPEGGAEKEPVPYADLSGAMQHYNEQLFTDGQPQLHNTSVFYESVISPERYGAETDTIGVLQIPCISVSLPIYSGASYEHLSLGAAVLGGTSLPIGGENTHCVIAAHRGWNAEDYLRDVEEINVGDTITVTNHWEVLTYRVAELKIILPSDLEQARIREGEDLLTLMTCHPYASGAPYRYLVICERESVIEPESIDQQPTQAPQTLEINADRTVPTVCVDGLEFESAATEIEIISWLPWLGLLLTAITVVAVILILKKK